MHGGFTTLERFTWTAERVDALKVLWMEGLSALQIAHEINCPTRSAVIGKLHRLGLRDSDRPKSNHQRAHRVRAKRQRRIRALKVNGFASAAMPFGTVSFADLKDKHCRYIRGDTNTADHEYCAGERVGATWWCEYHKAVIYTPVKSR